MVKGKNTVTKKISMSVKRSNIDQEYYFPDPIKLT